MIKKSILHRNITSDTDEASLIERSGCSTFSDGEEARRLKCSSGEVTFNPYLHKTHISHDIRIYPVAKQYVLSDTLTGQCSPQISAPPREWPEGRRDEWRTEGEGGKKRVVILTDTLMH